MATEQPPPPNLGAVFVDDEGTRCIVKSITKSDSFPGFYLVHLRIEPRDDKPETTWVLGPREFQALARERGLRPE